MSEVAGLSASESAKGWRRPWAAATALVKGRLWLAATVPVVAILATAVVYPLVRVAVTSFASPTWGFSNYAAFLATPTYVNILWRTFLTAAEVTGICFVLAYPYAYLMTRVGRRLRPLLLMAVLVPLFTSAVVRTFAWFVLLSPTGPVIGVLGHVKIGQLFADGTLGAVIVGMVQVLLPITILPLYACMVNIGEAQLVAAESLGAKPWRAFIRVYWPQTVPGVLGAGVLVFVSSLGFYLVPQLLGSPQQELIPQLLYDQIMNLLNYGMGDAAACITAVIGLVVVGLAFWAGAGTARGGYETVVVGVERNRGGRRRPYRLGLLLFGIGVAGFLVLPSLVNLPLSFTGSQSFVFPPHSWSVRWYENLFTSTEWQGSLLASFEVALASAAVATVAGTMAALVVVRSRSRWARRVQTFVLLPQVLPGVILALAIYVVFLDWGISGTVPGFVLAHAALGVPLVVIVSVAGFGRFEERLDHAAAGLGAGPMSRALRIWVPLLAPTVIAGAVLACVTSLDEFMVSFFLQGPNLVTLPVRMFSSIQDQIDPTVAAAGCVMLVVAAALVGLALWAGSRSQRSAA